MRQTAKHSHLIPDYAPTKHRVRALCGALVSPTNLPACYSERQPAYQLPLCPKCAALALIAEVSTAAEA